MAKAAECSPARSIHPTVHAMTRFTGTLFPTALAIDEACGARLLLTRADLQYCSLMSQPRWLFTIGREDVMPKEKKLLQILRGERKKGRRVLVYSVYTGTCDTSRSVKVVARSEQLQDGSGSLCQPARCGVMHRGLLRQSYYDGLPACDCSQFSSPILPMRSSCVSSQLMCSSSPSRISSRISRET